MRKSIYEIVTQKIIKELEAGTIPWRKTWKLEPVQNLLRKTPYRGFNALVLNIQDFSSPYWATFKQIQEIGAKIRKGEKSTPILYFKFPKDDEDSNFPIIRYYNIYNQDQIEQLPPKYAPSKPSRIKPTKPEEIIQRMPNPPFIKYANYNPAYLPSKDEIRMPTTIKDDNEHTSVLFHELIHSTGHQTRNNRPGVTHSIQFASHQYAKEELIAEIGAAFLCAKCQIPPPIPNNAAYINHWLKILKAQPTILIQAAAHAQKACDYILQEQRVESRSTEV